MKKFVSSLFLLPSIVFGASISGNFKSYPIVKDLDIYPTIQKSISNSAKIQVNQSFTEKLKFEVGYELTSVTEKHLRHTTPQPNYRIDDLNYYMHDESPSDSYKSDLSQNLNRFNFSYASSLADFTFGRTPISFGVSKSISPNDVLTPISITTIDKEERAGVDTLIVKTSLTENFMVEFGGIFGEDFKKENSAYFARPKLSIEKLEVTLSAMNFKEKDLLGIELQHPIKDAGFWIDYAFIDTDKPRQVDFSRFTAGIDYKFQNSLYFAFEYHYSGSNLQDFIFLRDQRYFILTSTYEITPLLITSLQTYFSNEDHSHFSSLKFDYNLTDNSYLTIGSYLGIGDTTQTEFRRLGKTYYGSYRYYF